MKLSKGTNLRNSAYTIDGFLRSSECTDLYSGYVVSTGQKLIIHRLIDDYGGYAESFMDKARIMASDTHPSIARVIDVFMEDNGAYFVSLATEGQSLSALTQNSPLPIEKAKELVISLAKGIAAFHDKGMPDLAIFPDNIVIDKLTGVPVLSGFSLPLPLFIDEAERDPYSAPERYGASGRNNPSHDIYSLGALLYRCVTGHTPPAIAHIESEGIDYASNVPDDIADIIDKAMEPRQLNRFFSISEFISALENSSSGRKSMLSYFSDEQVAQPEIKVSEPEPERDIKTRPMPVIEPEPEPVSNPENPPLDAPQPEVPETKPEPSMNPEPEEEPEEEPENEPEEEPLGEPEKEPEDEPLEEPEDEHEKTDTDSPEELPASETVKTPATAPVHAEQVTDKEQNASPAHENASRISNITETGNDSGNIKNNEAKPGNKKRIIFTIAGLAMVGLIIGLAYMFWQKSKPAVVPGPPVIPVNAYVTDSVLTVGPLQFSYTGSINASGLPDGEGTATYSGQWKSYSGNWKNGHWQGHGVLTYSNGDYYDGEFKNNFFTTGKYFIDPNGTTKDAGSYFEGTFKNGAPFNGAWKTKSGEEFQKVTDGTTVIN